MSDKPREIWISDEFDGCLYAKQEDIPNYFRGDAVRFIEYSAYEQAIKRGDSLETQLACVLVNNGKLLTERDEARAKYKSEHEENMANITQAADLDKQLTAERAKSAKLVEALKTAMKWATEPSLSEQQWDYLCGKIFREALTEYEGGRGG